AGALPRPRPRLHGRHHGRCRRPGRCCTARPAPARSRRHGLMITSIVVTGRTGASERLALSQLLTPDIRERVRAEGNRWIKDLRLVPYGESTMRGRFTFRGDSLWWFTEIYLHKMRRLE